MTDIDEDIKQLIGGLKISERDKAAAWKYANAPISISPAPHWTGQMNREPAPPSNQNGWVMHEGFVVVKDLPETRAVGIAGLRGRARGIHITARGWATTQLSVPGYFEPRAPCDWLENTCRCWPGSDERCDQCRDI